MSLLTSWKRGRAISGAERSRAYTLDKHAAVKSVKAVAVCGLQKLGWQFLMALDLQILQYHHGLCAVGE